MPLSMSLLLLAGIPTTDFETDQFTHFRHYAKAWSEARLANRPLLVILNPAKDSGAKPIRLGDVRKTKERRKLLQQYVVAVVNTGSHHGQRLHELLKKPELPRVVVIDKQQKYQIFKTSQSLQGQNWTEILKTYRTGDPPPVRVAVQTQSRPYYQPGSYSRPYGQSYVSPIVQPSYSRSYAGGYCPT